MVRESHDETRQGRGRVKREPLGTPRLKLAARVPNGMKGRWVNDTPGRIQDALAGGYSFIADDGTKTMDRAGATHRRVGVAEGGASLTAYLMAIPTVLYDEDQKAKQDLIDETDRQIKHGNIRRADRKDSEAFYVPQAGISVRQD